MFDKVIIAQAQALYMMRQGAPLNLFSAGMFSTEMVLVPIQEVACRQVV
jgi:hypothetical protein